MAKKISAPQISDKILAECLRKGLGGETRKVQGAGANPGFFPAGAGGLALANAARERGLIEDAPSNGRTKNARITERGQQFVLDHDDPKEILESLQSELNRKAQLVADAVQLVSGNLVQWQKDLHQQQHDFRTALLDVTKVLSSMKEPLRQGCPTAQPLSPVPVSSSSTHDAWLSEVIELVRKQKAVNSYSRPTLTQIFQDLTKRYPRLTIGQFHDGLRTLNKERRILLTAYTMALATLEDPQTALYLDREVKYYVDVP